MSKMKSLQLAPIADLTPFLEGGELVAVNVGADRQLYGVVALNELDYRAATSTGASFAQPVSASPQAYRVVAIHDGNITLNVRIDNERYNIHDIQPLPNNELLLVCCRSQYSGPDAFDKNGRVYSSNGELVREILLGDGIQQVQATSSGIIWASFFDEGVFGNFGWNDPIGASGLVASDGHGNQLYEFQPANGLDSICDCYALNVESDSSTWLYYYTEFPLVHLHDRQLKSHWPIPVSGSAAFAVSDGFALFAGGYDQRNEFHLFELGRTGVVDEVVVFNAIDEDEQPLLGDLVFGRFDGLYIVRNGRVYRCDVQMAAAV